MRRGFKAEAERLAEQLRTEMGKRPFDQVGAIDIATHIGAEVMRADQLTTLSKLEALEQLQPGAFSACTFSIGDRHVIVYSPLATLGRTQSDVAHEVAHIVLKHQVKTVSTIASTSFFTCDADEEQEANWLAGCLLLPRPMLLRAAKNGLDAASIATTYSVSETMASFRLRTTGVIRQLTAGQPGASNIAR
ncbi:MAG: ImmA/IrrE family metallo-endopeptidase [Actinomycetota bacterium]